MQKVKKFFRKLLLNFSIMQDFFKALWKYKLWWGTPVIFLILICMIFLLIAGHTGAAAFIYPLF